MGSTADDLKAWEAIGKGIGGVAGLFAGVIAIISAVTAAQSLS
ncbi:hypothetical protein ACNAWD_06110 [Rhodococcus erythropolis]|jgi:hypothetical protein|uniref:Uncharacterized protein n=1 Tax=Rhodococcus erythropolis TaxID=1833 RepID=A0AAX3V9Y8_RHOER|nr:MULTISPECIES: hypothetical protein [Rhodococcus]EEN84847.1 hypothetical protein RHOER0001_1074 [Rhodococcus erythropolis SK121]MCW0192709.1 hypothetical protein [Rhodococcus sp. (in: high G+C Gram-positive bacteria)]MBP2527172.1 hypothetical protein [Rhodococcus sp. PvP104]MCQ4124535.1 hypothetical protein [Rhodococcus erythropolis]MCQ4146741.1 hypothetical protein [Rhodococcus qingshengii]